MIKEGWRVFLRCIGRVLWVLVLVPLLGLAGCLGPGEGFPGMEEKGMSSPPGKGLERARELLEQRLLGVPGFAGIAHDEAEGVIYVFLENEEAKKNVPDFFEGFRVQKRVTGRFKALGLQAVTEETSVSRTGIVRPLVGGISLSAYVTDKKGNIKRYAGTLGIVTQDQDPKILSNAHVIAMDPTTSAFLKTGTPIIQPGSYDGGTSKDEVGNLEKYIPITFNSFRKPNYADAAIASIDEGIDNEPGGQLLDESGNYYTVSGTTEVGAGDSVRKSGRTTGVTTSTVVSTNASIIVYYGNKWAYFRDQILVNNQGRFIDAGDSGSCVDKGGKFVGLVFAGSSSYAVVCKAGRILGGLGISI